MADTTEATPATGATSARPYRMRRRLADVAETRQRIVEAAVELHGTVGPAGTTVSAIADRAQVQRSTVYRHFPDETALFTACTSHWMAAHPWPHRDAWTTEPDPIRRLSVALGEIYAFYDDNRRMLANVRRDHDALPAFVVEINRAQLAGTHDTLLAAWPEIERSAPLSAALGHAVDFGAWESLAAQGLGPAEAARLMTAMVAGVGRAADPAEAAASDQAATTAGRHTAHGR